MPRVKCNLSIKCEVLRILNFLYAIAEQGGKNKMNGIFLSRGGEAFGTGFLADAVGDALYRYEKREKLTSSDRGTLEGALTFLDKIYKGYLLTLPRSEAKERVQQMPPYDVEYTSAFKYAVEVWSALKLTLDNEAIEGRIELYRSVLADIWDDAECRKPLEDADKHRLLEVRRFFSKISKLTLRQSEQQAAWSPFLHSIEREISERSRLPY